MYILYLTSSSILSLPSTWPQSYLIYFNLYGRGSWKSIVFGMKQLHPDTNMKILHTLLCPFC